MKWVLPIFLLCLISSCKTLKGNKYLQKGDIEMANPVITIDSILFRKTAFISIVKPKENAVIHYSLGDKIVTIDSPISPDEMTITDNIDINFKAFHKEFRPSETISFSLRKLVSNNRFNLSEESSQAKLPYRGLGYKNLTNGIKGKFDFKSNSEWLGFQQKEIEYVINFEEPMHCKKIILSTLEDHQSWIFIPKKIELIENSKLIATQQFEGPKASKDAKFQFLSLTLNKVISKVKVKIYMDQIPNWHAGKGNTPWFFIDEIIVQ